MDPKSVPDGDTIEYENVHFYKLGDQWYVRCNTFFAADVKKDDANVPLEVKERWALKERAKTSCLQKTPIPIQPIKRHAGRRKKSGIQEKEEQQEKKGVPIMPLPIKAIDEISRPGDKMRKSGDKEKPFPVTSSSSSKKLDTTLSVEKTNSPILVTDSYQIIRTKKAELKAINPSLVTELTPRLGARKAIYSGEDNEKIELRLNPFAPPKRSLNKFFERRNAERGEMVKRASELIMTLKMESLQRKSVKRKLISAHTNNIVALDKPRNDLAFDIGDLPKFAASNGVTVLNLDRFICATDKRKIFYDSDGCCIFCKTHGIISADKHDNDLDCPFFFCACANCYLNSRLVAL